MPVRNRTSHAAPSLLQIATEVLVADPSAALGDVARAAGIGRTTLHKQYPTRHALLVALARDALDLLEDIHREADLDVPGAEAVPALRRLVTAVIPLGPRIEFLLRERSLDVEPDLVARVEALDGQLEALVRGGQSAGVLGADLPADWVVATVNAQICAAWELVDLGRLAPVAASDLVMRTLLDGIGGR